MKIPSQIRAGDSATWRDQPTKDNLGNSIDSGSWTLNYALRQGSTALTLTASPFAGGAWQTTITKTQSETLVAGALFFQAYAENGSQRVTLGSGQVQVFVDLTSVAAGAYEGRSQAQQDLDGVDAAIRALVTGGAKAYTIGGRSVTKTDMTELLLWRDRLVAIVASEQKANRLANGLGNPSNVFVRFRR